ncbi:MAG: AsmA-like C-terminal region-containing protein, partial [Thiogranum sp.]
AEIQVQRLDGLAKPLQDIVLSASADRQRLKLAAIKATVDDIKFTASAALPWGDRLTALAPQVASLKTLLQHAELDIRAQAADAVYRYATTLMGRPLDFTVSSVEATARPDTALTIRAEAALNDTPVTAQLQGEPLATLLQRPGGPWQALALEVRGDDIRLDATGSVAEPFQAGGFDVRFAFGGANINTLLPLQGAFSLSGHYADHPDRHLFDELKVTLGRSDIGGRVVVYQEGQRPRLEANLDAGRIHLDDILPVNAGETRAADAWDQPLAIGVLGAVDLDLEVRVRQLEGLAKPMQDIRLDAQASGDTLILAPLEATLDGTQLEARVQLPWGERLTALGKDTVSVQGLAQQADVTLKAQPPDGKLHYQTTIVGKPVDLGLTGFEASAPPGEGLQVSASALLDDIPLQVTLQAEPLAHLLQRPTGPWRHLTAEVRGGDIRFQASGSVDRPFEARGLDVDYKLSGARIDRLLPLFDVVLPLEGAYSLSGRFADLPDRFVFDELKIRAGRSDIGGRISVYQGQPRPRVVANLKSEQIYLNKLLPGSEAEAAPGAEQRVIPDYNLPIERMREIDGELTFKGKRLRTAVGDLGDISFSTTLKDGVFRLYPFQVRGWAGALIESDGLIDASQDPPTVEWNWVGRQLNYGQLLEQAGFAETVEGTIDVTLRLSGNGRTRHEFLSNADGQLIIVGQEGRFGSRRLDLWGSALVTTMLSREWHSEDVTDLNCMVARIGIEDGVASSDKFIVDTPRITIAATGTLDLETETLNLIVAPRPKRATLVALTSPVHVSGTLAAPEVAVTVLPRNRMATAGTGMLAGLINPGYLIFAFSQAGSGQANPCAAAVAETMAMKTGAQNQTDDISAKTSRRFSLLPGCTRSVQRPGQ